jgi:hypothetical protein
MDGVSFFMFFFLVVPLWLISITRKRKLDEQSLAVQRETNRLLNELLGAMKKSR